jgi:hypothetical protein
MNMSTISVSGRIEEASPHIMSPRTKARMAGGFCLATILTGVFTQLFISNLVVSGDAAASLALDTRCGMDQYVHLCWAGGHPMAGRRDVVFTPYPQVAD